MPRITVHSSVDPTEHVFIDHHLRPAPLLRAFDEKHFMAHQLPTGSINYLDGSGSVDSAQLNGLVEDLLYQIKLRAKKYKNFTVLKDTDFVVHEQSGLLILKFKKYPFVLKLFLEQPTSLVNPYAKGFVVSNMFIAGGAMRHTLGFTRIKTLESVHKMFAKDPYWRNRVVFPRKWFWLPKKPVWLYIRLNNLGDTQNQEIKIPAIYGLIADELIKDDTQKTGHHELMALSKFVEHRLDPHTKNFFVQKGTGKIALIDTELFPMILGFAEQIEPRESYVSWYLYLAGKYMREQFFTTRKERLEKQRSMTHYYL